MIYFVTIANLQTVIYVDLVTVIPSMAVVLVLMGKGNQIANKVMKVSKLKVLKKVLIDIEHSNFVIQIHICAFQNCL